MPVQRHHRWIAVAAPAVAIACGSSAFGQASAPSAAADAEPPAGLKHIKLSDDGSVWMSVGGTARLRVESWSNFAFGAPADDDDTFVLSRLLVHGDVHFGENVRAFVQGKSALSTDRDLPGGRRGLDVDSAALEQAYVDLSFPLGADGTLTVRPGRQTLTFGKQRLVSPLPWANTMRRWDGVSATASWKKWKITGFWTQFAPVRKYEFNDPDSGTEFYGVYATGASPFAQADLDLYFLALDLDADSINGTSGAVDRYTLGGRLFGKPGGGPWDFDVEGAYQFGEIGAGDIDAYMLGTELGFSASDAWGSPRFFAGFDYGSGDDTPGGDVETFDHLFPLGHAFLGYMDFVGRQNVLAFKLGATVKPTEPMTVGLTGHYFRRDSDEDALYNAGGGVVRAGGPGTDREVGYEIDLTVKYRFRAELAGLFGYSHFFAGDFLSDTGADDDMDFLYAQLQYTF